MSYSIRNKAYAYDFSIGTNTFAFHFEDESLSVQAKEKILSDLEIMQTPWTNREFVLWDKQNSSEIGYIHFDAPFLFPCFIDYKILNHFPVQTNQFGSLEILLSKRLSDEYKNTLNFVNTHRNAWNERTNFMAKFTHCSLTNLVFGDLKEFIYAINMPDSEYIRIHDVFIHKMLSYTFYEPNMLGFSKNRKKHYG